MARQHPKHPSGLKGVKRRVVKMPGLRVLFQAQRPVYQQEHRSERVSEVSSGAQNSVQARTQTFREDPVRTQQ